MDRTSECSTIILRSQHNRTTITLRAGYDRTAVLTVDKVRYKMLTFLWRVPYLLHQLSHIATVGITR